MDREEVAAYLGSLINQFRETANSEFVSPAVKREIDSQIQILETAIGYVLEDNTIRDLAVLDGPDDCERCERIDAAVEAAGGAQNVAESVEPWLLPLVSAVTGEDWSDAPAPAEEEG